MPLGFYLSDVYIPAGPSDVTMCLLQSAVLSVQQHDLSCTLTEPVCTLYSCYGRVARGVTDVLLLNQFRELSCCQTDCCTVVLLESATDTRPTVIDGDNLIY